MTRLLVLILLFIPLTGFAAARKKPVRKSAAPAAGPASTIADVSIVDVATGTITPHQDIVIRGERIAEIRRTTSPGKTVRYAIPGLWDMHVHLWHPENQFALYLANGVTGLRNMGADAARVAKWQAAIARGELTGPRLYTTGVALATKPASPQLPVTFIQSPADARRAFDVAYNQQMNFIQVLDMPGTAFEALAEASRHDGVPFAGHLPDSVSAITAAQDRMSSMEHLFGVGLACSSKEEELRNRKILLASNPDPVEAAKLAEEIMATYDPSIARQVFGEFKRFNLRQTPTLTFWSRSTHQDADKWASAPEFKQVSAAIRKGWPLPALETPAQLQKQYDFALFLTAEMAKAGVPILAGTDTGDPWTAPGTELHKELQLLVKAGLSPAQALRSATVEPAAMMRKPNDLGQVKKGFYADLVVLDANPLMDIRNTTKIHQVILKGKPVAGR